MLEWKVDLSPLGYNAESVTMSKVVAQDKVLNNIVSECSVEDWDESDELSSMVLFLRSMYKDLIDNKISFAN